MAPWTPNAFNSVHNIYGSRGELLPSKGVDPNTRPFPSLQCTTWEMDDEGDDVEPRIVVTKVNPSKLRLLPVEGGGEERPGALDCSLADPQAKIMAERCGCPDEFVRGSSDWYKKGYYKEAALGTCREVDVDSDAAATQHLLFARSLRITWDEYVLFNHPEWWEKKRGVTFEDSGRGGRWHVHTYYGNSNILAGRRNAILQQHLAVGIRAALAPIDLNKEVESLESLQKIQDEIRESWPACRAASSCDAPKSFRWRSAVSCPTTLRTFASLPPAAATVTRT